MLIAENIINIKVSCLILKQLDITAFSMWLKYVVEDPSANNMKIDVILEKYQ